MTKEIILKGMSCGHCVNHVKDTLSDLEGVNHVEVTLEDQRAVIELDADIADEIIKVAIDEAGYEVVSIKK